MLNGAAFLFANHIQCRQEAHKQYESHGHEGRNHIGLIVERGIEQITRFHINRRLRHGAVVGGQLSGILHHNLSEIGVSQAAFHAVDGIDGNHDVGASGAV